MQLINETQASLSTNGSGGFFTSLTKGELLQNIKVAKLDYLNIINLTDINSALVDPFRIGQLVQGQSDLLIQMSRNSIGDDKSNVPTILQLDGTLTYFGSHPLIQIPSS